jgi:hypothetical protein
MALSKFKESLRDLRMVCLFRFFYNIDFSSVIIYNAGLYLSHLIVPCCFVALVHSQLL